MVDNDISSKIINGNELYIKIVGIFNFKMYKKFKDAYENVEGEFKKIFIDIGAVSTLDSAALGMLLLLRERMTTNKKVPIVILYPTPMVTKILDTANFGTLFEIRN